MQSKAQVAVDILIRNLFERTADIGFLATDDDIREYLDFLIDSDFNNDENRKKESSLKKALIQRFEEYVAKYSVYENIILFDTNGEIKVQLKQSNDNHKSTAAFIREALHTTEDYVEYYDKCDVSYNEKGRI